MGLSEEYPAEYWALIEQYRDNLLRQALAIVGNHADAEDVVQETFSKAFKNREKMSEASSLSAWLSAINRGNAIDRVRAKRRSKENAQRRSLQRADRSVTTGGFSGIELSEILKKAIEALPPELSAVAVLRFVENRTHKEIAERLKVPLGTVSFLVCEATMQLHARLKSCIDVTSSDPSEHSEPGDER
jgi:RNA polymerase sigma-70 factor (ECF subfamily)